MTKTIKILRILWIGFAAFFLMFLLFAFCVTINLFGMFGNIPDLEVLENPKTELATEIYSSDHVLIGKYYSTFNRSPIAYEDIPRSLKDALIATEDVRFYEHSGIDMKGTFAIAFYAITFQKRGSSTISQQLAKNLFRIRKSKDGMLSNTMPVVKIKEWITAVRLEKAYTKSEILTMYLNTVDFGRNAYGIKSASKKYFNKQVEDLTTEECALLIGLLKGPAFYSPTRNEERAFNRRNTVISQMEKYGYLPKKTSDSIQQVPLKLNLTDDHTGTAGYFLDYIRGFLDSWCQERGYNLQEDGLKIYTSIDSRLQKYAEEAVAQQMKNLQKEFDKHWKGRNPWGDDNSIVMKELKKSERYKDAKEEFGDDDKKIMELMKKPVKMKLFSWKGSVDTMMSPLDSVKYTLKFLHTGFMSMDPRSGHVKAWVGDINYQFFKYDHVRRSKRQPGSAFKPILYACAMELFDLTPKDSVMDVQTTYTIDGKPWTPNNSNGEYSNEYVSLTRGLAHSINSVSAYLMSRVKPERVVEFAKKMGVDSPLEPYPTLALGTSDVSVYELVNAYCVFVNGGEWKEPLLITKIEDKYGNVLETFTNRSEDVLNEKTAYYMTELLRGSVEESGGTSTALRGVWGPHGEIGGKTGTTQNNADGWFIGISPELVSGAWVGGENRTIRFRTMEFGQGAKLALPIWRFYMQKVYSKRYELGLTKEKFDVPKSLTTSDSLNNVLQDTLSSDGN
ncbi:MAG: transglycosylase domain-containing protein [Cytophagaceae bacterium]|nr:transglycosylase domain-containing protein [Cytophagaceae bacterium]